MVHRDEGATYLGPIAQDVSRIRISSDKTAAELAVVRLEKEVAEMAAQVTEARRRTYGIKVPMTNTELLLLASGVVMLIIAVRSAGRASVVSTLCLVIIGGCMAYGLFLGGKRREETERVKWDEVDRVEEAYEATVAQLERNREIADS